MESDWPDKGKKMTGRVYDALFPGQAPEYMGSGVGTTGIGKVSRVAAQIRTKPRAYVLAPSSPTNSRTGERRRPNSCTGQTPSRYLCAHVEQNSELNQGPRKLHPDVACLRDARALLLLAQSRVSRRTMAHGPLELSSSSRWSYSTRTYTPLRDAPSNCSCSCAAAID